MRLYGMYCMVAVKTRRRHSSSGSGGESSSRHGAVLAHAEMLEAVPRYLVSEISLRDCVANSNLGRSVWMAFQQIFLPLTLICFCTSSYVEVTDRLR